MQAIAVVEHGNIFQDILLGLVARLIVLPLHALLLQTTKKALDHTVVPTISLSTRAAQYAVGMQQAPERLARILRSAVRVVNQSSRCMRRPTTYLRSISRAVSAFGRHGLSLPTCSFPAKVTVSTAQQSTGSSIRYLGKSVCGVHSIVMGLGYTICAIDSR